jgi:hypothetical protein
MGLEAVSACLVKELGADINQARYDGATPLLMAVQSHMDGYATLDVRVIVKELGADINLATKFGITPLYLAAQNGSLSAVRCLVKELGANVNQVTHEGVTPLIIAAQHKHTEVVVWLSKHGADAQVSSCYGTAVDLSKAFGAPAEQTTYLKARMHCANPGCGGAGLKKCSGCLKFFFCGLACIRAHWPAHKAECREAATKLKANEA